MSSKIKELTKDTAVYGISTILGRFLGFLLTPFYTHVLLKVEMGIFNNYYAAIAFLNVIFIYGLDAAFMKYASLNEEDTKKKIFSTAFITVLISSAIFSIILFLLQTPFLNLMDIPGNILNKSAEKFYRFYYYLIAILILDTITLIPFAYLRLERKSKKFAAIRLINIIANILFNLLFFLKLKMGLESIFLANLLASLLNIIFLLPDILKNLILVIDREYFKKMLYFGIPYLPASISSTIVQVIDRPVVERMTNYETLGVYSASYKLGTLMMLIVMMFQYAWQPFFLNHAKDKNAKEIFSKVLTLFVLFSSFVWIFISLFVDDLVKLKFFGISLYKAQYHEGLIIVPIVLLGYLFNGIYYNFQAGIYIEEKTKYFPVVTFAGAAMNVVVNILLIPVLGIIGAALATLVSYIVMAVGLHYYSQKFYRIDYEYGKVGRILFLIIVTGGIYYYLYYSVGILFIHKLILLIGFIGMLFVLGVVNKNEIINYGKQLIRR